MSLIVSEDEIAKSVHIGDVLDLVTVGLNQMTDQSLDVLSLNKVKEFEACRIEKIVPWHSFDHNIQNRLEEFILDHLLIVKLILQTDKIAKELQRSYEWSARQFNVDIDTHLISGTSQDSREVEQFVDPIAPRVRNTCCGGYAVG